MTPRAAAPVRTAFLAWLVPGLGHWLLGFRARAALFAFLVFGSLVFGIALDGKMPWTWGLDQSPLFLLATLGAVGSGSPYLLARAVLGYEGDPTGWAYDYGGAFVLTAGLMNLLLVLDAWDLCHGKEELILEAEAADGEDGENDADEDAEA